MSKYIDEIGIKSVKSLNKWFRNELNKQGKVVDLECVKVDDYVYVFWSKGDKLLKYSIPGHTIYCMEEKDIKKALKEIIKTI